jgi:hypothetical protein
MPDVMLLASQPWGAKSPSRLSVEMATTLMQRCCHLFCMT